MQLGQSIRHGAAWVLSGNLSVQILQFAVGVVLARLLAPADFGILVTIQIFTGVAGFLASGGMGQALVRAQDATPHHFQTVFTLQLLTGLVIYAVFYVLAPYIADWYDQPVYRDLIHVSALSFVLRPFVNMPSAWLQREMRFRQRTTLRLVTAPLGSIASIVLAWLGHGPWSLVIGGLASSVAYAVLSQFIVPVRPGIRFDAELTRQLGLYSVKFTGNDLVSYLRNQLANFLLGVLSGPTTVGLYNKADSLAKLPQTISGAVYEPIFRGLSKTVDDADKSQYIYYRTISLLAVYMLPIYFGLMWLAEPFIVVVYGEKWLPSALPLAILSTGGVLACIGHPAGAVLAANNWLGREIVVQVVTAALTAIACIVGIRWGLAGVATGLLVAWLYSTLHLSVLCARCIGGSMAKLWRNLRPGLTLCACMNLALLATHVTLESHFDTRRSAAYLLTMVAAGVFTYGACFLLLPIESIAGEVARWRNTLRKTLARVV